MTETKQIEIQAKWKELESARDQLRAYLGERKGDFGASALVRVHIRLGDYDVTNCFDMDELRIMREQIVKVLRQHVLNLEEEYAAL